MRLGIRLALGAGKWQVLGLVLRQALALAFAGLTAGMLTAVLLTRYLNTLLFGLTPLDRSTFIAAPLTFSAVVIIAVALSARRALTVDPLVALRHE